MIKHITIKIYEEVKNVYHAIYLEDKEPFTSPIEWIDNNGINTPYKVTLINKGTN